MDEINNSSSNVNYFQFQAEGLQDALINMNRMAEELKRYKLAIDNAYDQIIITDPEGVVVYANKNFQSLTGYSPEEAVGKTPKLWGGQMPKEFYDKMWKTIKEDKETFHGEVTNIKKNGEKYIAEISICPVFDEKEQILFFVGIERDISQTKFVEKTKTEFVSLASHQLRTPLTIIKWNLDAFSNQENLDEPQKKAVTNIFIAINRMNYIITNLLNVSRLQMGSILLTKTEEDTNEIITEIVNEHDQIIFKKGLKVEREDLSKKISIDKIFFKMIMQNVLSNAFKYSRDGGVVKISLKVENNEVVITVEDHGIGIPESARPNIFEKFYRASNAQEFDSEGTGIGLFLTKQIIDIYKGSINYTSQEEKGTIFIIRLPIS